MRLRFWVCKHCDTGVLTATSGQCIDGTGTFIEVDNDDRVTFHASVEYDKLSLGPKRCVVLCVKYNGVSIATLVLNTNLNGKCERGTKVPAKIVMESRDAGRPTDGIKKINEIELHWTVAELVPNKKYGTLTDAMPAGSKNVSAPNTHMKGKALGFDFGTSAPTEAHINTYENVWRRIIDVHKEKVTLANDFTLVANKKKKYDDGSEPVQKVERPGKRELKRKRCEEEEVQRKAREVLDMKTQEREALLSLLASKDAELDEAKRALHPH